MNEPTVAAMIKQRRLGVFSVSTSLMQLNPAAILQLMAHALVVQAVFDPSTGAIRYVAYSEYFDSLPPEVRAPDYKALFSGSGRGRFLGFTQSGWAGNERRGPGMSAVVASAPPEAAGAQA